MTPAGERTRRLVLRKPQAGTPDAFNAKPATVFVEVARVWAKRTPIRDAERVAAAQTGSIVSDRFILPWPTRPWPDATWQLEDLDTGETWAVSGVKPADRGEVEITAATRGDGA